MVRHRRMTRRFDPGRPVGMDEVRDLVGLATRAPSAGFTQGWDFVALHDPADRERYWSLTADSGPDDAWLAGVRAAPVLLLVLSDPTAYLDRYAAPDKGWTDRSLARWPVPYWDTDTAMAALLVLLGATDTGLASLFLGVPGPAHEAVKEAFGIPADRRLVGAIALGHEAERVRSPSLARGRREVGDILHDGRFGVSAAPR